MANKINHEPTASGLLPTDSVLVWEVSQTPHTRHASISQVLASMASLPARFSTITVGGVQLVPGPSQAQFDTLNTSATANANAIPSIASRILALQARVAALEGGGTAASIILSTIGDQTTGAPFTVAGTITGLTALPPLEYQDNSGAWISTSPVQNPESLTVNAISQVPILTAFSVTGSILNASGVLTLEYQDTINGVGGSWTAFTAGSTVSQSSYTLQHPAFASAAATVTVGVRDAGATSVTAVSNTFSVVGKLITLATPSNAVPDSVNGNSIPLAGTLTNYSSPPTLEWSVTENGSVGGWVSLSNFSTTNFTVPFFTATGGSIYTVSVRDAATTTITATTNPFLVAYGSISGTLSPVAGHSGNPQAHSINILIVGDGFTSADDSTFQSAVTNLSTNFASTVPYNSFSNKVNIYSLLVRSTNSGITRSGEHNGVVNTFFGANFTSIGSAGMDIANRQLLFEIARENLPAYTAIYVVANTIGASGTALANGLALGGLGGGGGGDTFTHELGHALYSLSDEYGISSVTAIWSSGAPVGAFGNPAVNITDTVAHEPALWQSLNTVPAFLQSNPNCNQQDFSSQTETRVGRVECANHYNCGLYRPQTFCKMGGSSSFPFCVVCRTTINNYLTAL